VRTDYPNLFLDDTVVDRYRDVVYAKGGYAAAISARQRAFLRELVAREFATPPVQHDFACGTGRALLMLDDLVSSAHGYDVSPAMLRAARDAGSTAELHRVPIEGPTPEPARTEGPALVTMFRLLLNAAPAVRDRALAFAAAALPTAEAGLLVLENHGRSPSLRHLGARRRRGEAWFAELTDGEVTDLLARHGFRLVGRRGCALTSRGWYRRPGLRGIAGLLDDRLAHRLPAVATNVLYLARRAS
jgi:SAM-dependent methyltransferase